MGQVVWITGVVASAAVVWAVASSGAENPTELVHAELTVAYAEPEIGEAEAFPASSGSALAAAAFGMSALQPETYNGEIVMEIIKASPLSSDEKSRLSRELAAVDAGQADLSDVLFNVRMALALE